MKFFKMNSWKRMVVLGITLVGAILAIVLVPMFYTSKNVHKSKEYAGGSEYVVQIQTNNDSVDAAQIAEEIYSRIDRLGISGVDVQPESNGNLKYVRVTYPGATTPSDIDAIRKEITEKPHLVFTDIYGNPLFTPNGNFNPALSGGSTITGPVKQLDSIDWNTDSTVPVIAGSAKPTVQSSNNVVQISIKQDKEPEWEAATQYISKLGDGKNMVLAWLNPGEFITKLKNTPNGSGSNLWDASQHNMYNAAFINNDPSTKHLRNDPSKYLFGDAENYLISYAAVSSGLTGNSFVIQGNFSQKETIELAKQINFGAADYGLKTVSSSKIDAKYGNDAFQKAVIAGIVVFAIIALLLIVNYGLLGALSTISIALFVMITLTLFSVMRGEYSPESIAALIVGIGVSVDANIITFERLKYEIYNGSKLQKAEKIANRKSFWTIFDANITTLIVAVVLFYFGTRNIVGLSITLMLSIVLTLIIMLGFTRITSTALIRTGYFDNKLSWLGVKPKIDNAIQAKFAKVNYMKASKYFSIISAAVILGGVIAFAVTAGIAGNISGGLNLSTDFKAGTSYEFKIFDANSQSLVEHILNAAGFNSNDFIVTHNPDGTASTIKVVSSSGDIVNLLNPSTKGTELSQYIKQYGSDSFLLSNTSAVVAQKLVKDAMIAVGVALAGIVVYSLIRFRWTYAIAAILALIHDGIIVVAMFAMTRVQVSPVFVAGLLSILGFSINDTIVTFDRIREKMNSNIGALDKTSINRLANAAIVDTIKRSLLTSMATIISVVVLMCFGNATRIEFNFALLIGLVFGTYSSIVIATYFWVKLETIRQKAILKREKSNFWRVSKKEEQTIQGINDFKY